MAAHAMLGPSGAHRWLTCTPSAKLETQFPDQSSLYAAEGSYAHAFAELKLQKYLGLIDTRAFHAKLKLIKDSLYYRKEAEDYVDAYVTYAVELIAKAQSITPDAVVMLEQKLDFSEWVPGGFGTGDLVIVADGTLEIMDLKFGKGVQVYAEDNPQMRLYALGAYAAYEMLYDIQRVRMTIHQPRLDHIDSDEITVDELLKWAEEYVRPRAKLAAKGEGEFVPGEKQCQFCRARATCKARAEANLEMAKHDFCDSFLLSNDEVADILAKADELVKWAADIKDYALDQAVNYGVKFPGWKLVEGRSNRAYSDDCKVAEALVKANFPEEKIYKPSELLGITAMEKEIGKKLFGKLLDGLIVKPPGKPTLAPESDKRPEISSTDSAAKDFQSSCIGCGKILSPEYLKNDLCVFCEKAFGSVIELPEIS